MAITQECCVQSSTSPGSNTPQDTNCTDTCPLSRNLFKLGDSRHAGHCWRSRDELIRDVLLWIPTHGRAKAGRPARTYIQQLCEDTGCCPEDLPRAMNDREEWRERVRDIRAASTIWWWWWSVFIHPILYLFQILYSLKHKYIPISYIIVLRYLWNFCGYRYNILILNRNVNS